jgi:hypothetical protein
MGGIDEDESVLDPKALGQTCGPVVHLMGTEPKGGVWHGTVLMAVHSSLIPPQGLQLTFASGHTQPSDVMGVVLYSQLFGEAEWSVVRFGNHQFLMFLCRPSSTDTMGVRMLSQPCAECCIFASSTAGNPVSAGDSCHDMKVSIFSHIAHASVTAS